MERDLTMFGRIYQTINIDKLISAWYVIHYSNYASINCKQLLDFLDVLLNWTFSFSLLYPTS